MLTTLISIFVENKKIIIIIKSLLELLRQLYKIMTEKPFKAGHFVYPPLKGKFQTRARLGFTASVTLKNCLHLEEFKSYT
jgi:hypothetical protein